MQLGRCATRQLETIQLDNRQQGSLLMCTNWGEIAKRTAGPLEVEQQGRIIAWLTGNLEVRQLGRKEVE